MLSVIEKMIFLKSVSFFREMTVNHLKTLASVCEEMLFPEETTILSEGDPGGTLYMIVSGRVSIEQTNAVRQSLRLNLLESRGHFGEDTLFDNSPSPTSAITLQDTLTLQISHQPLALLMQQYPGIALHFLQTLSKRMQAIDEQIADLSRAHSRPMHKVYDKLDF
ncbi:MAG: Crp/Fnr family transcriptional regulator [Anaerolineae bacterium]|nr:Crp/Fnr family transcriptional regulator [Anaerolineae bacterium]